MWASGAIGTNEQSTLFDVILAAAAGADIQLQKQVSPVTMHIPSKLCSSLLCGYFFYESPGQVHEHTAAVTARENGESACCFISSIEVNAYWMTPCTWKVTGHGHYWYVAPQTLQNLLDMCCLGAGGGVGVGRSAH